MTTFKNCTSAYTYCWVIRNVHGNYLHMDSHNGDTSRIVFNSRTEDAIVFELLDVKSVLRLLANAGEAVACIINRKTLEVDFQHSVDNLESAFKSYLIHGKVAINKQVSSDILRYNIQFVGDSGVIESTTISVTELVLQLQCLNTRVQKLGRSH